MKCANFIFCMGLTALLFGCGLPRDRVDFDLAAPATVYTDSKIQIAQPQVLIHPNVNLEAKPTALMVPLGVTQAMNDQLLVSQGVSRQVWQQMLQEAAFSALELTDMRPPYRVDMALPLASSLGADLLVGGYVTYYLDGGHSGDSSISIHFETYDVKTGNLIWSVVHAASLPYKYYRDFIIIQARDRRPADPMGGLIAAVAGDFAQLLHMWTEPAAFVEEEQGGKGFLFQIRSAFGRF